jgi:predicted DNA-binding ribbon-helix-helix protein
MEFTMHRTASESQKPAVKTKKNPQSTLISKNITVDGHRTSVRLEPAMWNSLVEICRRERASIHMICSAIAQHKPAETSLTAAIRVFIMSYFRAAATEEGHAKSGHGQGPTTNAVLMLVQSVMDPSSVPHPLPSPYIIGKAYTPPEKVAQTLENRHLAQRR